MTHQRNTSGLVPYQQQPDQAKQAARAAGLKKFNGNRCKYGHSGIRYSSSGNCVECVQMYRDKQRRMK